MNYGYTLPDGWGVLVVQGVSEDGLEESVWQFQIAHGDVKRVLGHKYINLVETSE